jgi:energy-coupling factor transporter ATP-binding protein EcfA2
MTVKIKPRERDTILRALQAGVVPRIGLHHIQVGRKDEVAAVLKDIGTVADGGAAVRFIIGRFGSGKTFYLNLIRTLVLEKKFVVVDADITNERRLYSTGGHARALYSELMKNMSTRAKPMGGALPSVVERWISSVDHEVRSTGAGEADVEKEILKRLQPLQDLVSGYDFAAVLTQYLRGYQAHDDHLQQAAIRWLRAEYTTKTDARKDLGVRSIITDSNIYEYLKLMAAFVHLAGYQGLWVNFDEMVVLSHRLSSSKARQTNYEAILHIVNDCLQGGVSRLGFLFSGTDEFLEDRRRGLFSYEALATRLADNTFARQGVRDLSGPVIRLENLTPEDVYVLLDNIRRVQAGGDNIEDQLVPDEALEAFLQYCSRVLGEAYFKTPRDTVKNFVQLLNVVEQNPDKSWRDLLELTPPTQADDDPGLDSRRPGSNVASEPDADRSTDPRDDDLVTFKLK